jgi:tetratricopeptide (TPR) repeat protein
MDQVVAENPANPEAYGRKAQLLYQNDRADEAEATLQKALDINPNYPFGYLLRGMFRQNEGEIDGALLLFRKAAQLYDPEAHNILGQLYAMIADSELKRSNFVAARAAIQIARRCQPASEELRESFQALFGEKSQLPLCARREYAFRTAPTPAARPAWDQALEGAATGKLADAVRAFEQLTAAEQGADAPRSQDPAAWFNLGLARAWCGDNRGAIDALDQSATLDTDDGRATEACVLAEVLRCGYGMEELANYLEYSVIYQLRDPQHVVRLLQEWQDADRLVGVHTSEEQSLMTALVLEKVPALTPELAATRVRRVEAHLLIVGDRLRLWNTNEDILGGLRAEVEQRAGAALSEPRTGKSPAQFNEILLEAVAFPGQGADQDSARTRLQDHLRQYFEETWLHRPLRSLNQVPPIDAAGHPVLRNKLRGAVQFLQECALPAESFAYDFDRLRHKLGIEAKGEGRGTREEGAAPLAPVQDIGAMNAADLGALPPDTLADQDLELAYQTALKLDARELSARFARQLVGRPPRAERADRYAWYAHLVQHALANGDTQAALDFVNDGEKADCEQNDGRRRNDYELRRGQVHARRGETEEAQGVFQRLIDRLPGDLRFRGSAAEAMLSANQPARALTFAEGGLAKAREKNDRDSEEHFKELVAAARKRLHG